MNPSIYILSLGILSLIVSCASYESKLRARAEAGEAEAQYQLARMLLDGNGVTQDPRRALLRGRICGINW